MLKHVLGLALILASQASFAGKIKFRSTNRPTFNSFIQSLNENQGVSLASVRFSPQSPKQGDKVTAFVELKTGYEGSTQIRPIVSGKLDGREVSFVSRGLNVWILQPTLVQTLGEHQLELQLWIEDQAASQEVRKAMTAINQELARLTSSLSREIDEQVKAQLQRSIDEKNRQKVDLENTLSSLKRPVGTKNEKFSVGAADPSNSVYPKIESIQPQVGSVKGGVSASVSGRNLDNVTSLKIGSVVIPASELVISANKIDFKTPVLSAGLNTVEVEKTIGGEVVISTLQNAFYALEPLQSANQLPVAFAGLPGFGKVGEQIPLDGSRSYDPAGAQLTYSWSIISKPRTAPDGDGVFSAADISNPTFSATTEGNWIVALVVKSGQKFSLPSLTTITVGSFAPLTVVPSSIEFSGPPSLNFNGPISVCNNKNIAVTVKLVGTADLGLSYSGNLRLQPFSCFQTVWYGSIGSTEKRGNGVVVLFEKPISTISIPYAFLPLPVSTKFYSDSGATAEINGYFNLNPSFDEESVTSFFIKNVSENIVNIVNPPFFTYQSAYSNFPQDGISLNPGQNFEVQVHLPARDLEKIGSSQLLWGPTDDEIPRSINLSGGLLNSPKQTTINLNFPDTTVGQSSRLSKIFFCSLFFDGYCGFWGVPMTDGGLTLDQGIPAGTFSFNKSWTTLPYAVTNDDSSGPLWVEPIFTPTQPGDFHATISLKLRGYAHPFIINLNGHAVGAK